MQLFCHTQASITFLRMVLVFQKAFHQMLLLIPIEANNVYIYFELNSELVFRNAKINLPNFLDFSQTNLSDHNHPFNTLGML